MLFRWLIVEIVARLLFFLDFLHSLMVKVHLYLIFLWLYFWMIASISMVFLVFFSILPCILLWTEPMFFYKLSSRVCILGTLIMVLRSISSVWIDRVLISGPAIVWIVSLSWTLVPCIIIVRSSVVSESVWLVVSAWMIVWGSIMCMMGRIAGWTFIESISSWIIRVLLSSVISKSLNMLSSYYPRAITLYVVYINL